MGGSAEVMGDNPDPNFVIVPGVPLVNKETGEIECVVLHLPEVVTRLDATLPVSEWAKNYVKQYNYPRIVDQYLEIYKTARKQPRERTAVS